MYPLLFNLGMTEIIVIVLLIVLFFGGRKIPELMRGMGHGVREFKDALEKPATDKSTDRPSTTTDQKTSARTPKARRNGPTAKAPSRMSHKKDATADTGVSTRRKRVSTAAKPDEPATPKTGRKPAVKTADKTPVRKKSPATSAKATVNETASTAPKTAKRPARKPAKKVETARTDE